MEIQKYDQRTNQGTDGLTWVGARDTCLSKNKKNKKNSDYASFVVYNVHIVQLELTSNQI